MAPPRGNAPLGPEPGFEEILLEAREVAERVRRREVSRALDRLDLSPEEEEVVERFSRSLVDSLLRGPIPGALARAGRGASSGSIRAQEQPGLGESTTPPRGIRSRS